LRRSRIRQARFPAAALVLAVVAVCVPVPSLGQSGCVFLEGSRSFSSVELAGGQRVIYLGTPNFRCNDGVRIRADSAVAFSSQHLVHFIGSVRFRDAEQSLVSDDALYFTELGRLQASGHMVLRDTLRGSVIENGHLDYLRKSESRLVEQMTVTTGPDGVRPRALLYMRPAPDTAAADTLSTDTTRAAPRAGNARTAPDSGVALPDTTVRPDTLSTDTTRAAPRAGHARTAPDSGVALPDTTVRPDTTMRPDTTLARPSRVVPDTIRIVGDTMHAAPPDTTSVGDTIPTTRRDTAHVAHPDSARAVPRDTAGAADTTAARPSGPPPIVRGRPTNPEATPDTAQTPYTVVANRLELHGDSAFIATGNVSIERDSLHAFSDTAVYDQGAGHIVLNGAARVESSGYDLAGRTVNLSLPGGEISRIRALHDAVLTGDQLRMTAPTISVFVNDGAMDRLVATPIRPEGQASVEDSVDLAQPVALAEKFRLSADSLDVRAPGQVLDKMYAVGAARGESSAGDSLNVPELPEVARKDWIEGDTLVVTFVKVEPRPDQPNDSAHYDLDNLVARGDARSLYRILPSDSTARPGVDPPAIHYVLGTTITIVLDSGQVDHMEVEGPRGWHLEPLGRPGKDTVPSADTAKGTATDTAKSETRPDTGVVRSRPKRTGGGGSDPAGRSGDRGSVYPMSPERERGRRRRRQR
jgi:hypothetical protein